MARPDAARAGSPRFQSVEEVFLALESPLLHYALRLVQPMATAEDIVQEAFLRLHARYDRVADPKSWLYRTVHNLAISRLRRETKWVPLADDSPSGESETPDPSPLPDEQIARCERVGQVRLSLEALDERSREVVRLRFHEDLSYKEIGAQMGLAVGHVGYLLHHALRTLAADLERAGTTR